VVALEDKCLNDKCLNNKLTTTFSPDFIAEHGVICYGISFGQVGSAVLAVYLPNLLPTPSLLVFEGAFERKP